MATKKGKTTKGPWTSEVIDGDHKGTNYQYSPHVLIKSGKGHYIGTIKLTSIGYSGNEQDRVNDEANARLIAAAPELLEAIQLGLYLETIPAIRDIDNPAIADFFAKSRALIEKIKG